MTELYYTFNKNIPNKVLSKKNRNELLTFINIMNLDDREVFFQLIKEHYFFEQFNKLKNENSQKAKEKCDELRKNERFLPYKAIEVEEGLEFDLDELPSSLIHILYKFIVFLKNRET